MELLTTHKYKTFYYDSKQDTVNSLNLIQINKTQNQNPKESLLVPDKLKKV